MVSLALLLATPHAQQRPSLGAVARARAASAPEPGPAIGPRTEQEWIVRDIAARHTHLARKLGLPGDARTYRNEVSRLFGGLRLYPIAAVAIAHTREEANGALPGAAPLARTRPELVTDWAWKRLRAQATYAAVAPIEYPSAWVAPFVPAGTAFDADHRPVPEGSERRYDAG